MDQAELDVALEELELRLERLRALYEQYFLGLERIEPAVARKDVDRRIYVLRREKIRNTARRFKLQTVIQRYNTFQQYWQRICREIENGTYKRHLLKAQKANGELLTIAARKRLGRAGRLSQAPEAAEPSSPPGASSSPPASPAPAQQVALAAAPVPGTTPPATAAAPKSVAAPQPAAKLESLDLDMDFMSDWDPAQGRSSAKTLGSPFPVAKPAVTAQPAPQAPAARPAAPTGRIGSIPPRPVSVPPRPSPSAPPRAPAAPPAMPRIPIPASPRIPALPSMSRAAVSAAPKPAPVQPAPAPTATRLAPPPKPVPPPKPAAAAAAAPPKPAAASSGADDQRLRDLHARLQQAKQQTKEANVSFEGLAKSIRAAEAKLREQHKNRKIDFDVVIKDGRAVVKPIVR